MSSCLYIHLSLALSLSPPFSRTHWFLCRLLSLWCGSDLIDGWSSHVLIMRLWCLSVTCSPGRLSILTASQCSLSQSLFAFWYKTSDNKDIIEKGATREVIQIVLLYKPISFCIANLSSPQRALPSVLYILNIQQYLFNCLHAAVHSMLGLKGWNFSCEAC